MWISATIAATLLPTLCTSYSKDALKDLVTSLPGSELLDVSFKHFSGYLKVGTQFMHYEFVESMSDPENDPLSFWTNGGPGCSGLLGFFGEQGPFRPNSDLTLSLNPYAWNKVANMVFMESPCGVGYSYSDVDSDYVAGDKSTALTNYMFIQQFLDRFPEYSSNEVYLSSESYGGHYLPTLAKEIVERNPVAQKNGLRELNFQGFAVGNPYTTVYSGLPAMIETAWGHQLIAQPTMKLYRENQCENNLRAGYPLELCEALLNEMFLQIGNLNPYALDFPVCTVPNKAVMGSGEVMERYWMLDHILSEQSDNIRVAAGLKAHRAVDVRSPLGAGYEPCEEDYMTAYANRLDVKKALHVNPSVNWKKCSSTVRYNRIDGQISMVPLYKYLIDGNHNLRILVYSGDDDGVCGTVGTQQWIWKLGYEVKNASDQWQVYKVAGQTAGYYTRWRDAKLAFVTIHGAGHEVPTYKPAVSLDMWARYLKGEWTG